jgi:hypothetical protein
MGKPPKCQTIIKEWHEFLGATVKFLHEVQERQMLWQWGGQSAVFDNVSWLQALWASRSAVCYSVFLLVLFSLVVGLRESFSARKFPQEGKG